MNILALETSTEACSVALLTGSGELFSEFALTPREHTRHLPRMMDQVLTDAGLAGSAIDAVAYANGPGAFTGVRIAAATAQGMAIGLAVPLVPVSTLAVLAQQACDQLAVDRVLATLDARMDEVYAGDYRRSSKSGLVEPVTEEVLIRRETVAPVPGIMVAGSGVRACREVGALAAVADDRLHEHIHPTAAALVKLARRRVEQGHLVAANQGSINYLRNRVAWRQQ